MGGAKVASTVVPVVEVPGLFWLDEFAAAAARNVAAGDERLELSAAGDVGAAVAA
jgi:hypothetical protein